MEAGAELLQYSDRIFKKDFWKIFGNFFDFFLEIFQFGTIIVVYIV